MKNLEASTEKNASTFCLLKDYCSQTMGGRRKLIFLALLGVWGWGEKRSLGMAMCIVR